MHPMPAVRGLHTLFLLAALHGCGCASPGWFDGAPTTIARECAGAAVDKKGSHAWGGGVGSMDVQQFSLRLSLPQSMVLAGGIVTLAFPGSKGVWIDQSEASARFKLASTRVVNPTPVPILPL